MRCVDDEIQRLVSGDSVLFGVSMSSILLYLSVSLGKIDIIESRFLLAWSGIVTVMLSLAAAFGTVSYHVELLFIVLHFKVNSPLTVIFQIDISIGHSTTFNCSARFFHFSWRWS